MCVSLCLCIYACAYVSETVQLTGWECSVDLEHAMSNVIFLQEDLLNPGENSQKKWSYVTAYGKTRHMG